MNNCECKNNFSCFALCAWYTQMSVSIILSTQQEALCRLLSKLSVLEQLRDEAEETRRQTDRHSEESRKTERQTQELETRLLTLDTTDPQHVSEVINTQLLTLDTLECSCSAAEHNKASQF